MTSRPGLLIQTFVPEGQASFEKPRGGATRHRTGVPQTPAVYCFPLACGCDASALSRFVHHVLDSDLCTAEAVVIVAADDVIADGGWLGVLNLMIGRLAARHVSTIVVSGACASLEELGHRTYSNFPVARFVASEGDAAQLILHSARQLR